MSILILEYIEGQTLDYFYESNSMINGFDVTMHCIYYLLHLSNIIKFTHYDLHPQNIIIKKLHCPQTFTYKVFDKDMSITTDLFPIFIDYASGYLENVDGWCEIHIGHLFNGVVPT
ncbi:Protein kinase [Orpheovirus IHUMI-LCC2]|uniref:Protein kinase n=1 Tax=Orpheovirus IHUMI-LCC2 TaxID=2023057 RepID=A0A2I2L383_9VIRU|nr:Protein kinase [Orpheovirus IHUMI-LCC2]SNW61998.1 Protein kinase [Orpheovirus IHUMI-LCC2]